MSKRKKPLTLATVAAWVAIVIAGVSAVASVTYSYSECDGTFVRGLFGFECIQESK